MGHSRLQRPLRTAHGKVILKAREASVAPSRPPRQRRGSIQSELPNVEQPKQSSHQHPSRATMRGRVVKEQTPVVKIEDSDEEQAHMDADVAEGIEGACSTCEEDAPDENEEEEEREVAEEEEEEAR